MWSLYVRPMAGSLQNRAQQEAAPYLCRYSFPFTFCVTRLRMEGQQLDCKSICLFAAAVSRLTHQPGRSNRKGKRAISMKSFYL